MILFNKDENGREIEITEYQNVLVKGTYPNVNICVNPINETVMSLKNVKKDVQVESNPVFFFMYNTDNYYHFVYDMLPYLWSYVNLKRKVKNLKLLIVKPKYRFVTEFLELLNPNKYIDIIYVDENTIYSNLYVSSSYTHGIDSNLPPHKEFLTCFDEIKHIADFFYDYPIKKVYTGPDKLYISRRTHIHGKTDNIGTNYTTRRKMENEDELVEYLTAKGYTEVFTELLPIKEVLALFYNAKSIIGPIGGGMANCLFCRPDTEVIPIISPGFLDVNERFKYCFTGLNYKPFFETEHIEKGNFKKYMRVQANDVIGEIVDIDIFDNELVIQYSDEKVSGWNADKQYRTVIRKIPNCVKLDDGLNSAWEIDLEKFKEIV